MKASLIIFPGSNCDRDIEIALQGAGFSVERVHHDRVGLGRPDVILLPGGFSYGDYLRPGAIAARSPVMRAVGEQARRGVLVIGVCNGFQSLLEAGLLPGALLDNIRGRFVHRVAPLLVGGCDSPTLAGWQAGERIHLPLAHICGRYVAPSDILAELNEEGRIALRYDTESDIAGPEGPNGSMQQIAGIVSQNGRVLGLMPHPERHIAEILGGVDGARFFAGLALGRLSDGKHRIVEAVS